MLQDISIVSPQLNVKQFTASKKESSEKSGFFNLFQEEITEETPVLNVKEFRQRLDNPKEETEEKEILFSEKKLLNSAGLEMMSLSDEAKDSKWISAEVSKKTTAETDDASTSELTQEESDLLLYMLLSLFGNRTDTALQNQTAFSETSAENTDESNLATGQVADVGSEISKILSDILNGKSNSSNIQGTEISNLEMLSSLIQNGSSEESLLENGISQTAISDLLNEVSLQLSGTGSEINSESLEVLQGIVEKLRLSINEGKDYTIINLEPSEFGKLFVSYNADSGKVNVAASNEAVKNMIENNLDQLQEALSANGVEVEDLKIEKINFSKSNTGLSEEMKNLMEKISSGEFNLSTDEGMLTNDMKEFVDLFIKSKTENKDAASLLQNFSSAITANLNNEIKVENADSLPAQKIIDTVVKKITESVNEGRSEIEIKLVPENLGKLTVKIISEEGKLSANIEVKNLEVKQAIDAGMVKLKDNLEQNGIFVEQINVSLSEDYYSRSQHERYSDQGKGQKSGSGSFEITDIEETESVRHLGYNTLEYIA